MADVSAASVAQQATRLGLVTAEQIQQCREEAAEAGDDPFPLVRCLERKGLLTPLQSHKLLKGENDGFFLGGFRLMYKIASGSFGRVFRADDPRTGQIVAIKILRKRWSEDPHTIELFEREGKVGMSLRHPNIVSILAVSRDAATGQYYIVMDFVEGGNLRDILGIRKKLEPAEALTILEDAANALAYAYTRGVTHRDIKPTNILISSQKTAKLVDFGLAGMLAVSEGEEQVDRTVDYAGIEKATGAEAGDVRSDIYFLGCVAYEMLTGRPPLLMTRDRNQRMQRDRFTNVTPMQRDEVNAPPLIFHLVENMMAFNPKDRYQTPAQLVEAIRKARAALGSKDAGEKAQSTERRVFVVEKDERLKEVLRDKLKARGFRVFLAADPNFARDRFRQNPFDALIMDARTVGEEGIYLFETILAQAAQRGLECAGILMLSDDQSIWTEKVKPYPRTAVMVGKNISMSQLYTKLSELLAG